MPTTVRGRIDEGTEKKAKRSKEQADEEEVEEGEMLPQGYATHAGMAPAQPEEKWASRVS